VTSSVDMLSEAEIRKKSMYMIKSIVTENQKKYTKTHFYIKLNLTDGLTMEFTVC